jgi:hypothetical protein
MRSLRLQIDLDGAARVAVDGSALGEGTRLLARDLAPGHHAVRIEAEGRAPLERDVTLGAGEIRTLAVKLPVAPPPRRAPARPKHRRESGEGTINPYE